MSITKVNLQNKLERWKQMASQLISGSEETSHSIELDPAILDKCRLAAEERQTTVNHIVNEILEQHWLKKNNELPTMISREQMDRNPLFLLDALTQRELKPFGETQYEQS
ncbi:hypothetical protein [Paenibacillus xerothermodurans]|uniref:Uncharacterized protein n=1 Tax=Paenibacillus xerothermodurans TaxID=1977292 RepID=A0A2W1NAP4_PAEXE|nr:hypothetical protein [Paenibacillus xerothermodurans]PZE21749.1 hypothetical protein CBW46_004865 [Paenibacillus xerothermodurans]